MFGYQIRNWRISEAMSCDIIIASEARHFGGEVVFRLKPSDFSTGMDRIYKVVRTRTVLFRVNLLRNRTLELEDLWEIEQNLQFLAKIFWIPPTVGTSANFGHG